MKKKLLSNRTLLIITTTIDPRIPDRVATCGGTPHALAMPTTKGVIADAARSSARVLRTPGHVSRTDRDGTTPRDCDVSVRYPRDNGAVMIGVLPPPRPWGTVGALRFSINRNLNLKASD